MSACRVIVALTARRTNVKRTDMSKASAGFPTEQHVMAQPHGGLCTVLFFCSYCIFCQVAKLWQNFLLISLLPVYTYLRVQHVVRTNYLLWLFHRTFILASPHVHSCPVALFSCVCVRVFFIRIVRANRWYVCVFRTGCWPLHCGEEHVGHPPERAGPQGEPHDRLFLRQVRATRT